MSLHERLLKFYSWVGFFATIAGVVALSWLAVEGVQWLIWAHGFINANL